jgi:hypothetical protein
MDAFVQTTTNDRMSQLYQEKPCIDMLWDRASFLEYNRGVRKRRLDRRRLVANDRQVAAS